MHLSSHKKFLKYGVGIVTYFQIMYKLSRMLVCLSLLAVVQMILYWAVGGYGHISAEIGAYALTSFGNVGFAKAVCSKDIIDWQVSTVKMNFQCEKTTQITEVLDAGILLSEILDGGSDNVLAICDSKHLVPGSKSNDLNQNNFDKEKFKERLMSECRNWNECNPVIRTGDIFKNELLMGMT